MSEHLIAPLSTSLFYAVVKNGKWYPGIGDPSVAGWLTTVCYFLAAILCFYRAWCVWPVTSFKHRPRVFWLTCGILMLLLCINKQLDLQQWLTQVGRDWARAGGWYNERREFQLLFVKWVAGITAVAVIAVFLSIRGLRAQYYVAAFGLFFIASFLAIRAASFHHVDHFLGFHTSGFKLNWVLEIGGIIVVGLAALCPDRPRAHPIDLNLPTASSSTAATESQ